MSVKLVGSEVDHPQIPPDEELSKLYAAVLDHLLFPPQVKESLIATQTREKKWQTCLLHRSVLDDVETSKTMIWSDRDRKLLSTIKKSRCPDIKSLIMLKTVLTTANQPFMVSFLDAGGIFVLVKCVEDRLNRNPMTDLDAALLFEIMSCFKTTMNNATGMEGIIEHPKAIERIVSCLNFTWKPLALQVLEILSVCCYYSERSASMVIKGMRILAKSRQEAPFSILTTAIIEQDIEVKASILQFVNNMVMGLVDLRARLLLRSDLSSQLFSEKFADTLARVEEDLEILGQYSDNSPESVEVRNRLVTMCGPNALTPLTALTEGNITSIGGASGNANNKPGSVTTSRDDVSIGNSSIVSNELSLKRPFSVLNRGLNTNIEVSPGEGTMAGLCIAAKGNKGDIHSKMADMFGVKKTKHRWYELDGEAFKWCTGRERELEFKGSVSMSTVIDIRYYTTDPSVAQATEFAFEFETTERVFSLGTDTLEEKEAWVRALQVARDRSVMSKSSYKLISEKLSVDDIQSHYNMFKKQGTLYNSLLIEDRMQVITKDGLDTNDAVSVARFLNYQLIAEGLNTKLVSLMQELLLMPPSSDTKWDALVFYARELRHSDNYEDVTPTPVALLGQKESIGGSAYGQVSKLAMLVMGKEAEIFRLSERIGRLEKLLRNGGVNSDTDKSILEDYSIGVTKANESLESGPSSPPSSSAGSSPPASPPSSTKGLKDDLTDESNSLPSDGIPLSIPTALESPPPTNVTVSSTSLPPIATSSSMENTNRFAKFLKMKSSGIPEGAIRQKMTLEGFSQNEIEDFFAGKFESSAPSTESSDSSRAPPSAQNALMNAMKFAKYEKMQKSGVPEAAIRQKMLVDGLTEEDCNSFLMKTGIGGISSTANLDSLAREAAKKAEDAARKEAEAKRAAEELLPPEGMRAKIDVIPPSKMKGIFWAKMKRDEVVGTVWHKADEWSMSEEEKKMLVDWFGADPKKNAAMAAISAAASPPAEKVKLVSLFDGKRTQNVSIALGKMRKTPKEIVKIVIDLDPLALTHELTLTLLNNCPTKEEISAVTHFDKPENLDAAGMFFLALSEIPRLKERLDCHDIAFRWDEEASVLKASIDTLMNATIEMKQSEPALKKLLQIVLAVGNFLNGGTPRGQAYGVKLEVLLKLANVKGNDGQSLLHFIAEEASLKSPEILAITSNWSAVWAAAEVSQHQIELDMKALEIQIDKTKRELREGVPKLVGEKGEFMSQPLKLRLTDFLSRAEPRLSSIKTQMIDADHAVKALMSRYGEGGKGDEDATKAFFETISGFGRSFQQAVDENTAKKLEAEKKAKRAAEALKKKALNNADAGGAERSDGEPTQNNSENIFGNFHKQQNATPEALMEEFKRKMANREKKVFESDFETRLKAEKAEILTNKAKSRAK